MQRVYLLLHCLLDKDSCGEEVMCAAVSFSKAGLKELSIMVV